MAGSEPFDQLIGTLDVYLAPVGEAVPAVNTTPAGNWVRLGATDGGQTIMHNGSLEKFSDDDHTGNVKAVRPEEEVVVGFTLVGLTLENYAAVINKASLIATASTPSRKTMPLKKGYIPQEYAMLLKGDALSPYGILPGQYVIPRGVFDGEPEAAFTKDERAGLEIEFAALEDDDQVDENMRQGWLVVQTS